MFPRIEHFRGNFKMQKFTIWNFSTATNLFKFKFCFFFNNAGLTHKMKKVSSCHKVNSTTKNLYFPLHGVQLEGFSLGPLHNPDLCFYSMHFACGI